MATSQTHFMSGPAGQLETLVTQLDGASQGTAVLCHPHPLYGGSMHDRVLDICAQALIPLGLTSVRFNFRGVGASAGISGRPSHEEKQQQAYSPPEVGDLCAVIDTLAAKDAPAPVLIGYSFGANVLWHALEHLMKPHSPPTSAILIAPPTKAMAFDTIKVPNSVALDAIWCDGDDYVDSGWFADQPAIGTHTIQGGDHFFSNRDHALASTLRATLGYKTDQ